MATPAAATCNWGSMTVAGTPIRCSSWRAGARPWGERWRSGELEGGQAGGALVGGGEGGGAGAPVEADLDGALDVAGQPESDEAVVEGGHRLLEEDLPRLVDDPHVEVLVGELALAGGEAVVEALVGLVDVGGHGQVEAVLRHVHGQLLLPVGEDEFVGADGGHEVSGPVGAAEPVEVVDDLGDLHPRQAVGVEELRLGARSWGRGVRVGVRGGATGKDEGEGPDECGESFHVLLLWAPAPLGASGGDEAGAGRSRWSRVRRRSRGRSR